jgi:four helix bundle protein
MSGLPYVETFRNLIIYKKARALSQEVFQITKSFPREEMYSLTDQNRRSSHSIGTQITETWAKRTYEKHFLSKLTDADGEQQETQHWIETVYDCEYLTLEQKNELISYSQEIGRLIGGMMSKSSLFCDPGKRIREETAPYRVNDE